MVLERDKASSSVRNTEARRVLTAPFGWIVSA